uniref:Uncharacterized protein n=1 Tax=Podoviridae sp. ctiJY10 TaxID=2826572 RepID=A0A8S5N4N2_9CAUD|nr:MAG TPA: hypothetical protein [Podoviridae sp. ctiJY10]
MWWGSFFGLKSSRRPPKSGVVVYHPLPLGLEIG